MNSITSFKSLDKKGINLILLIMCFFALTEASLQIKKYYQSKQGLIAVMIGKTRYVQDDDSGLKILNRHYSIEGFRVNSLGLRSEEIPKNNNKETIVFLGASTVMGEMTSDNSDRFSEILARSLRNNLNETYIHINAGIAGFKVNDQKKMLARLAKITPIKILIIYPGFNDVSDYCTATKTKEHRKNNPLFVFSLPDWWLTTSTIRRYNGIEPKNTINISEKDYEAQTKKFEQDIDDLLSMAIIESDLVITITSARSFTTNQNPTEQEKWFENIRPHTPCLNFTQVNKIYDLHNKILQEKANEKKLHFINAAEKMNGKTQYFKDSTHLSLDGEKYMAKLINDYITQNNAW